jgi:multiple sugar transport system ATP-binding protein
MVFQNYAIFPHLNVFENIAFPLRARHWAKDAIGERVAWALELPSDAGEAQPVAAARATPQSP